GCNKRRDQAVMQARASSKLASPARSLRRSPGFQVNSENLKFDAFLKPTSSGCVEQRSLNFVSVPKLVLHLRSSWGRHLDPERHMVAHFMADRTDQRWKRGTKESPPAPDAVPRSDDGAVLDSLAEVATKCQDALFLGNVQYHFR